MNLLFIILNIVALLLLVGVINHNAKETCFFFETCIYSSRTRDFIRVST